MKIIPAVGAILSLACLTGCYVAPPPYYYAGPPAYYGAPVQYGPVYPAPAYYYGPPVSVGFGFGGRR